MFEALHTPVSRLMRVRFGPIALPSRVKRGQMLKLEQKEVVKLLEWAGLPLPKKPLKQLSPREKDKATTVFTAKVRKRRGSILDRPSREGIRENTQARKPAKARHALNPPTLQRRSDRNRGRG